MIHSHMSLLPTSRSCIPWLLAVASLFYLCGCATPPTEPFPSLSPHQSQSALLQLFHQDIPSFTGEVLFQRGQGSDIGLYVTKGNSTQLHLVRVGSTWAAEGRLASQPWMGSEEDAPRRLRGWIALLQTYESARSAPDGETIRRFGDQWASILKEDQRLLALSVRYKNLNYRVRFSE